VNVKNADQETTPLNLAVQETHKEIIELLITKGADVNAMNDFGTPLESGWSHSKIADLLRKHGGKRGRR